ncbi:Zn(2)-C6 fungal-type DNA-binding domain protein [Sarocladium implicatum]|nr:Zn(2)-C6 fungal-type DNA-binding domain protein [Sarocladium implicatum]
MESPATSAGTSSRIKACEPCRANKLRCRPSLQQSGVCQRCLDSRKECVSRAAPRIRRARQSEPRVGVPSAACPASSVSASAPNVLSPQGTFSIDLPIVDDAEDESTLDVLSSIHETHVDSFLPSEDEDPFMPGQEPGSRSDSVPAVLTPCSSQKSSTSSSQLLNRQPQFDLASAQSLLDSFKSLVSHFPCVSIPKDATVQSLASTRPFLLLAILASAAGSKTLQGHRLYDAEFRKVLGLKYVAGGERTLELLQGLLVYCSWYPFQLRPKKPQLLQYVRMMGDLVQDLSLDEESDEYGRQEQHEKLDRLRAYIGCSYLRASMMVSWLPRKGFSKLNNSWTLKCCDLLQSSTGCSTADANLCQLTRLAIVNYNAIFVFTGADAQQDDDHRRILMLGLKAQARELQQQTRATFSSSPSVEIASLSVSLYLDAGNLLQKSIEPIKCPYANQAFKADHKDLVSGMNTTRQLFDYVTNLDAATFATLTTIDWCRIILSIIVALRMSFPVAGYPQFDYSQARAKLRLSEFLSHFCGEEEDASAGTSPTKLDISTATRVVLRIVKRKFDNRVAAEAAKRMEETDQDLGDFRIGCPVLDGSVDQVLPMWDAWTTPMSMNMPQFVGEDVMTPQSRKSGQEPVFHDIWATMTMSWARDDSSG